MTSARSARIVPISARILDRAIFFIRICLFFKLNSASQDYFSARFMLYRTAL